MNMRGDVTLPKWLVTAMAGCAVLVFTAVLTWAGRVEQTQRCLLQDVSRLDEFRAHVTVQLTRIEDKLDGLASIEAKLDRILGAE